MERNPSLLPRKVLTAALAGLLLILLVSQAVSLLVFPVPDSIRWFGDESWLMTESIELASTGELRHPLALGSTLSEPKSFILLSFPWLRAIAYGVPAAISFPANPVNVGRVVTFVLSLCLIALMIVLIYRRTKDLNLSVIYAIALVLCESYFFASHSARPDIVVGLFVLAFAYVLSDTAERSVAKYWFWVSFAAVLLAIGLPVHLYLLLFVLCAVAFVVHSAWKNGVAWLSAIAGILAAILVASAIQFAVTGHVTFTGADHGSEFKDVSRDVPLLKLFSMSVQRTVLQKHFDLIRTEARLLFLFLPFLVLALWWRRKQLSHDRDARLLLLAFGALFVWYFLERPHPAYLIHVLPLVVFATALQVHWFNRHIVRRIFSICILLWVPFSLIGAYVGKGNGESWTTGAERNRGMERAVASLSKRIERGSENKPLVMVEASATKPLLTDTSLRLMTTHFQFFPLNKLGIGEVIDRYGVDYCIIFNTPYYGYDRNTIDPLVHAIKAKGELIGSETGEMFDIGRNYFWMDTEYSQDTLFLYKIRKE